MSVFHSIHVTMTSHFDLSSHVVILPLVVIAVSGLDISFSKQFVYFGLITLLNYGFARVCECCCTSSIVLIEDLV